MDAVSVVVVYAFSKKAAQMLLVQNDHVIQQFAASAFDPSFRNPVLPGTSEGRSPRLDSDPVDLKIDLM